MKVCLIRPPLQVPRFQLAIYELPPIGLAYLAAAARQVGHEVNVIDALAHVCMPQHFLDLTLGGALLQGDLPSDMRPRPVHVVPTVLDLLSKIG